MIDKVFYLFVLSLLAIVSLLKWSVGLWGNSTPSFSNEILSTLSIGTLITFYLIRKALHKQPIDFIRIYLGSIALKIIVGVIFISILLNLDSGHANQNASFFILCYITFTAVEVVALVRGKR